MFSGDSLRTIALVRIGKIGDLIVTNFAIRKIRLAFPHAHILLVTLPRNKELLKYSKDVDEVVYFHKGVDLLRVLLRLRMLRADLLIDFNDNRSSTSAAILRFGGASVKVGFVFDNKQWLTVPVNCPPKESVHISQRLRMLPEAIGMTFDDSEIHPSLTLGVQELMEVKSNLQQVNAKNRNIIALNLSAGDSSRYWQTEKWHRLMREIQLRDPGAVFLLLHASRDTALAKEVAEQQCPIVFPSHTSFQHFAAYISCASIQISPDTSAIHIGCAFRIPLIGLYPAVEWNFQRWRPMGTLHETVRPKEGLVPDIQVDQVIEAYQNLRRRMLE